LVEKQQSGKHNWKESNQHMKDPHIMTINTGASPQHEEKDPHGVPSGVPGAKLDAGKDPVTQGCLHYFPKALRGVARVSAFGARKYSWKGWRSVPNGIVRYGDALGRHELELADNVFAVDPQTGCLHAEQVAWNALARLELIYDELAKRGG